MKHSDDRWIVVIQELNQFTRNKDRHETWIRHNTNTRIWKILKIIRHDDYDTIYIR